MHLERLVGRHGMSEKKVVAFIVEGTSDEAALGSVMKEYFSSNEVQFVSTSVLACLNTKEEKGVVGNEVFTRFSDAPLLYLGNPL